ncbi:GPI-anchored surface protein, putative [Bodo saltans]|uniref:GPI-anchored surface protein, putative n=1 Tax=Bodo saltans TaxID=75058 RepID=A0A0S4KLT2_BODSA|nr:GPI-anchored surface protein, putative [Bodo saltans]|eukprot:CUI11055.1 GPI-anchored surface protein, putative [Bodo saltans]
MCSFDCGCYRTSSMTENTIDIIRKLERLELARGELQEALCAAHIELCNARRSSALGDVSVECVPLELSASIRMKDTHEVVVDASQDETILKWFGERPTDELRQCQSLFKRAIEKCVGVMLAENVLECSS